MDLRIRNIKTILSIISMDKNALKKLLTMPENQHV